MAETGQDRECVFCHQKVVGHAWWSQCRNKHCLSYNLVMLKPIEEGFRYVSIRCKTTHFARAAENYSFVHCECCQVAHGVNNKIVSVQSGQSVYGSFKLRPFAADLCDKLKAISSEKTNLEQQLKVFRQCIEAKDICYKNLAEETNKLRAEFNQFAEQLKKKEEFFEAQKKELEEYRQKFPQLQKLPKKLKQELDKEKETTISQGKVIKEQKEQIESLTSKALHLEGQLKERTDLIETETFEALKKLTAEKEELKKETEDQRAADAKKTEEYKEIATEALGRLKEKEEEVRLMKRAKEGDPDEIRAQIHSLRSIVSKLENSLEKKEAEIENCHGSIHNLTYLLRKASSTRNVVSTAEETPPTSMGTASPMTDGSRKRAWAPCETMVVEESASNHDDEATRNEPSETKPLPNLSSPLSTCGNGSCEDPATLDLMTRFLKVEQPTNSIDSSERLADEGRIQTISTSPKTEDGHEVAKRPKNN